MASLTPTLLDLFPIRQVFSDAHFTALPTNSRLRTPRTQWKQTMVLAMSYASAALASPIDELPEPTAVRELRLAPLDGIPQITPTPQTIAETEEILLMDTRIPYRDAEGWEFLHPEDHELKARAAAGDSASSTTTTFEITISSATTATLASSSSSSQTATRSTVTVTSSASGSSSTATASSSSLPTFFDGGMSVNWVSDSCPTFLKNMINDEEFNACYPVSLLLQGSNSFFEAEKSLVSISQVLDHACQSNSTSCASYLADIASNLTKSENCGDDYKDGTETAVDAYLGLVAYQVVYDATCLKDNKTAVYCFGNAVTNTTNPSETYFYYLPLNESLPGGTNPTCGGCLQDTMDGYHAATSNRNQPIAETYEAAAQQVDTLCGSSFANASLAEAIRSSDGTSDLGQGPTKMLLATTVLAMVANWLV